MLNKFKNTKSYLDNYSKELVKLLKIEIGRNRTRTYTSKLGTKTFNSPINSSGKLKESIEAIAKETSKGFSFNIMANDYALNVDQGRGQGRYPDIYNLINWIRTKPVRIRDIKTGRFVRSDDYAIRGLAHNISRKIAREGIKPTNFISDAIEDSMEKLNKLGETVGQDVLLNLDDILVKAGYIKKGDSYIIKSNN